MMQRTDRHFRVMMRHLSAHTLLYTEMVTTRAIIHGDRKKLLGFAPIEHPLVLQIGGDDPQECAQAAKIAVQEFGYDEINLNVGCPSSRVQSGNFGACLMAQPEQVLECVLAMSDVVDVPITVKHRIGIDDLDKYDDMLNFVDVVAAGKVCRRFTVHARKAWLQGLSPKENRTVPPLRYEDVYRLKLQRPDLVVEINGGIKTMEQAREHLHHVDAVMIGRAAYDTPFIFAQADAMIYGEDTKGPSRAQVVRAMLPYIEQQVSLGEPLHRVSRHLVNLFAGQRGARRWRQHISERHHLVEKGPEVIEHALSLVPQEIADAPAISDVDVIAPVVE